MKATDGVIYLCKHAVNNRIPEKEIISSLDLEDVYRESCRQMLTAMVGMALQSAGVKNSDFDMAVAKAKRKAIILEHEQQMVFKKLDEAGIWHLLLKGSVLKDWYPKFGMRESADCDILFDKDREEDVRDIMLELGYSVEQYGGVHHDVYYKKPVTNMQMHVALFGRENDGYLNEYFGDMKDRLLPKEGCEYVLSPEDFYIYVLAHNCRSYRIHGTGIRYLLDTYVFLRRFSDELNWDYIRSEAKKLGMDVFEETNRSLAMKLFGGGTLTDDEAEMLDYCVSSGAYGTAENRVKSKIRDYGGGRKGRIRYVIGRVFLPVSKIKTDFPVFYKYKILIPFLPFYRLVRGIVRHRKKLCVEWKSIRL